VPNTPSDSKSNTYTAIATELFLGANNRNRCYHALNATGGSSHTFTGSIASGSVVSVIAVEITTATTTAAESSARQTDNATAFLSPGTTTTHADSLLIGFQTLEGGSATYTPTHGNSFTGLDSETDGDLYYPVYSSYRAVSSGTYNTSITVTGSPTNTGNWVMAYYEVPPVISGCRLLQNGTDKRLTQNGTDGRILQGGGDCELGGGGPAVVPVRMMIGVGL
jgi:hypothetical protein